MGVGGGGGGGGGGSVGGWGVRDAEIAIGDTLFHF